MIKAEYKGYYGIGTITPSYLSRINIARDYLTPSDAPFVKYISLGLTASLGIESLYAIKSAIFSYAYAKPLEFEV